MSLVFMVNPVRVNAQVTIKETMELADTTSAKAKYVQQEAQELRGYYLDIGGRYSVTVDFFLGYRLFDLWEEGLGHVADYSYSQKEIDLGSFDQWTNLNFYLYNADNDYKLPPEDESNLGGAFIRLTNEEIDSSRATIPPSHVLHYYGNPFKQAGEITLDEQWGYIEIQDVSGTGAKSLYMEKPYKKRLVGNVQDSVGKNIRIGPVTPGDSLRFYITSSHNIVSGRPLYGENKQDTWLYFEDWTDLNFRDVQIRLHEGLMPADPNEIDIDALPYAAIYGDTSYVYFSGRTRVGRNKNFPDDQRFDVWIDEEARQYGTLLSADRTQQGASLSNVPQPVLFVSNTVDELGFEPGFSSLPVHAQTSLQSPYPPYRIEGEGKVRLRREALKVGFEPMTIAPGDTTTVQPYFQYRDGQRQYFPDDHEFFVVIVRKGQEFGHLVSKDGEELGLGANYISPGFKYVAHEDIEPDSAEVWFYLGTDITYERDFVVAAAAQKTTGAGTSAAPERTPSASNSPEDNHLQEIIAGLKADGQDALAEYLNNPRPQTLTRTKSAVAAASEEGKTGYEVGYGRLVIKESKDLEITMDLPDQKELWPTIPFGGAQANFDRSQVKNTIEEILVEVTRSEEPVPDQPVIISAEWIEGSGGHNHNANNDLKKPPSELMGWITNIEEADSARGELATTTNSDGELRLRYRTPSSAGRYGLWPKR
ncbi:MAG: hypothetical protein U5J95_08350 [Balneolaceae bacterium]|nr:hypothetical protein [Balneolaceae bacterium]